MITKRDQKTGEKAPAKQTAKRKQSASKAASKKKPAAKKAAPRKRAQRKIVEKDRGELVAEAAYLIAQQRGFEGNYALDDWLQAEVEIDARLSCGRSVQR